jgi:hypothetical protein
MCIRLAWSLGSALLIALLSFAAAMPAAAGGHKLLATDAEHVAIRGYDTVAYFTDRKAIKGSSAYEYAWDDAKWRFASAAHRDLFIADPDRYMPQFGGFCAGAMANGVLVPANPEAWAIVDGKLYMIAGRPEEIVEWKADAAKNIKQADKQWPVVQGREAAQQQ